MNKRVIKTGLENDDYVYLTEEEEEERLRKYYVLFHRIHNQVVFLTLLKVQGDLSGKILKSYGESIYEMLGKMISRVLVNFFIDKVGPELFCLLFSLFKAFSLSLFLALHLL